MDKSNTDKSNEQQAKLNVQVDMGKVEGKERVEAVAYVFSPGGKLLGQAPVNERGLAAVEVAFNKERTQMRVVIGPKAEGQPMLAELQRRGVADNLLRGDRLREALAGKTVAVFVDPDRWKRWLRRCTVRGRLLKHLPGVAMPNLPIRNATIEIYEVDPLHIIFPTLPNNIIESIRDVVLRPRPFPEPDPNPIIRQPIPLPDPIGPISRLNPAASDRMFSRNLKAMTSRRITDGTSNTMAMAMSERSMTTAMPMSMESGSLQNMAQVASTEQFRQYITLNPELIRPYLCHIRPWFVTKQLVATATTDINGRFEAHFYQSILNPDQPDLYFIAKQSLAPGAPPTVIYERTPVPCYTYWDYECGSEVTLITDRGVTGTEDPGVIAPPNWVLLRSIGGTPLSLIHHQPDDLTTPGFTNAGQPWGGNLGLYISFDNDIRTDSSARYYQVSWRKGTSGSFTPLLAAINRHYAHEEVVGGVFSLVLEAYALGPRPVGSRANLFEIPPLTHPDHSDWDLVAEAPLAAVFPTGTIAPGIPDVTPDGLPDLSVPDTFSGLYQLKVELFDAAGNPVDVDSPSQNIHFCIPTSTDLGGTINTRNATAAELIESNGIAANAFVMNLHVDNNRCYAIIHEPMITNSSSVIPSPAGQECGALHYSNTSNPVGTSYHAVHRNGFATYSFDILKGHSSYITPPTVGNTPVGSGSSSVGNNHLDSRAASDYLGTCHMAGFAANLYVSALATDGSGSYLGYDARDQFAFAIGPEE